jgi:hypothetical protein
MAFCGVRVVQSLMLCLVFLLSHYWFFLLLYCLSLDLRLLITPLVASTDMENQMIKRLLNT